MKIHPYYQSSFYIMFKAPEHQVAGHQASDGKLGPLVDDSGRFYKPLQGDGRGSKELAFYETFSSDTRVPDHIRRIFPVFYGSQVLEASNGSGLCLHLVMQDIASGRINPSILDVKIGSRTWYPGASDDYIKKCLEKDGITTTVSLGFRISGLWLYEGKESGFWKPGREEVRSFTVDDVRSLLRRFVSSNSSIGNEKPDCSFAPSIYGGSTGVLEQLLELKAWFVDQTIYHFHSCSLLILFDKESALKGSTPAAQVKLIDFAHVLEGKGVINHNFLGGLCSLIKFVSDVLSDSNESSITANAESEKPHVCTSNGN
ncbi:Inositol polyphosphate multikinase beta [Hibiscus syriacus]|uniref:Inositol polyphosphate multikinase n=1 Tax=Hibiscus syriacus TaxID=106335 RepID=A0A6A2WNE6_HIBSY|nr:inositol polyphosphate multikinase alpha-like [Hibiscus syriacus]KAE8661953.1 Inositol polyphosphate multikinase beta [Hibiscus syriacus]